MFVQTRREPGFSLLACKFGMRADGILRPWFQLGSIDRSTCSAKRRSFQARTLSSGLRSR